MIRHFYNNNSKINLYNFTDITNLSWPSRIAVSLHAGNICWHNSHVKRTTQSLIAQCFYLELVADHTLLHSQGKHPAYSTMNCTKSYVSYLWIMKFCISFKDFFLFSIFRVLWKEMFIYNLRKSKHRNFANLEKFENWKTWKLSLEYLNICRFLISKWKFSENSPTWDIWNFEDYKA